MPLYESSSDGMYVFGARIPRISMSLHQSSWQDFE